MAYSVVRIKTGYWTDRFKSAETDTEFEVDTYPELDAYLTMMEERGWTVVNSGPMLGTGGAPAYFYATFHRPDPEEAASLHEWTGTT